MARQDVNRVLVMGNLVRDPDVRQTSGGKDVAHFTVAVNRGQNKSGDDMGADFVPVVVWGNQANAVGNYLSKGRAVFVEGRLTTSTWEKDGKKYFKMEVTGQSVKFMPSGKKKQDDDSGDQYPTEHMQDKANGYAPDIPSSFDELGEDVDIPF